MNLANFTPKTLDEAIEHLYSTLTEEDKEFIRNNSHGTIHHFTGMALRNAWGLWKEGTPFKKDIKKRFNLFGHGDDCSGLIFEGVWAQVKGEDVNTVLTATAKRYTKHWKKYGVNPETGKEIKKKR